MDKVKMRLCELGYCGYSDNEQLYRIALMRYQKASGLAASGYINDETLTKLFGGADNENKLETETIKP